MNLKFAEISRLGLDIYNKKVTTFKTETGTIDANEALRQLLLDKCGGEWSYRSFKQNEHAFYEIVEEIVTQSTSDILRDTLDDFIIWKDTELGDRIEFIVENTDLFEVSVVADGTRNTRRQRLHNGRVQTTAFNLSVKIYEEWNSFMMGKIDWSKLIDRVVKSIEKKINIEIGKAFKNAYTSVLAGDLKVDGAMNEAQLLELTEKVGNNPVIYGTKIALSKIPSIQGYVTDADDKRSNGYVRMFNGIKCVELENNYDKVSKTYDLENDKLFIVPEGDKIVYGGFEGQAIIKEDTSGNRLDMQVEFDFTRRLHLGVAVSNRFGVYKIF